MVVESRSEKRNAKNARGLGRDILPFFPPPPPPFPSRARLIFALLVLIRSHYTIWEPGTGYQSWCWNFLQLNPKGLHLSSEEAKERICFTCFLSPSSRENRKFHVVVMLWRPMLNDPRPYHWRRSSIPGAHQWWAPVTDYLSDCRWWLAIRGCF